MLPVLLIAEAANPEWASVPLVGWSFATAIARATPAHIVTQVRNREAFLRQGLVEGRDFTAIDSERVARPIHRISSLLGGKRGLGWTTTMALNAIAYPYFERLVWRQFGAALRQGQFALVHRITPLSPTLPSSLAGKCHRHGVPFLLGPLNGGLRWPKGHRRVALQELEILSFLRNAYKLVPGRFATLRHASRILVGSRATEADLPARFANKVHYMPENGLDPQRFTQRRARTAALPLRLVYVGRLVPYKGPDLVLEAAAPFLRRGEVELTVVGDGPLRGPMETMAATLGVAERVRFAGWVQHAEVQHQLAAADLFLSPSVREFGGGAALEAMATGLPPVVVDYGGPGEIVDDAVGWKIAIGDRAALLAGLQRVLTEAVAQPGLVDRKGAAAVAQVWPRFAWDNKAQQMLAIYREVLAESAGLAGLGRGKP